MSRRSKYHYPNFSKTLKDYAESRFLDFHQYSPFHMRVMDGGLTTVDFWTTGKYYVLETNYHLMGAEIVERGGEKGNIDPKRIEGFLDKLFFPESEQ